LRIFRMESGDGLDLGCMRAASGGRQEE